MIFVKRYKCKTCNKTFSILPQGITRYRRYANIALENMVDWKLWT
jgi:transposase-like protein